MANNLGITYRLASYLYDVAFPIYRPFYHAYKAITDRTERKLLDQSD